MVQWETAEERQTCLPLKSEVEEEQEESDDDGEKE